MLLVGPGDPTYSNTNGGEPEKVAGQDQLHRRELFDQSPWALRRGGLKRELSPFEFGRRRQNGVTSTFLTAVLRSCGLMYHFVGALDVTRSSHIRKEIQMTAMTPAQELLAIAQAASKKAKTWIELSNAIYGIGGPFSRLFPEQSQRMAFGDSPEHKAISVLIEAAPEMVSTLVDTQAC